MKREYWTNPKCHSCRVDVVNVGDSWYIVTPLIFHPDEGGQPFDRGTIGGSNVIDVQVKNGSVLVRLDPSLPDGSYEAKLDSDFRLQTSRAHSAQHIISGIAEKHYSLGTTSVHIGNESTIDFDKEIDWDTLIKLEHNANNAVLDNLEIKTTFGESPTRFKEKLENTNKEDLRVVTIGNIDSSACCGAHVLLTGEIGQIRIISLEKKRGGTRIAFTAGFDSLNYSTQESSVIRKLKSIGSCSTTELPDRFQNLIDETKDKNRETQMLWDRLIPQIAKEHQTILEGETKIGVCISDVPPSLLGKLSATIVEANDSVGIAISGTSISIISKTISANDLLKRLTVKFDGRGGGKETSANGKLGRNITLEDLEKAIQG